jgi:hypothetical protein
MRLIDADKLDWWYKGRPIRRVIDEAPTVDAVPVVRCKECWQPRKFSDGSLYCPFTKLVVEADDFCSYGKKRGDSQ